MVLALQFSPSTFVHLKKLVSIYDLVPPYVGIKPNFTSVPYLIGSWLYLIEDRRGDHFQEKLIVFIIIM